MLRGAFRQRTLAQTHGQQAANVAVGHVGWVAGLFLADCGDLADSMQIGKPDMKTAAVPAVNVYIEYAVSTARKQAVGG